MFNLNQQIVMSSLRSFLFGIVGALFVQGFFYFYHPSTIVTVNITGLVSSFIKETAKQSLTMEEKEQRVKHFTRIMQKVLDETANNKKVSIMPSEAVIAGSSDLTHEIAIRIKQELKP